jgi:hypothetical protein
MKTKAEAKMVGLVIPGDEKVPVPVRDWDGMRRQLWRSKASWEIAQKEATNLLAQCAHMEGCAGKTIETAPCLVDCPDRELRMSALVILNAARQFAPIDARRLAEGPYYAPSREHFSEVLAELAVCQVSLEAIDPDGSLRLALREKMGSTESKPVTTLPPQLKEAP